MRQFACRRAEAAPAPRAQRRAARLQFGGHEPAERRRLMTRIPVTGDLALVRQVMFRRLRDALNAQPQNQWRQLEDDNGQGFENYVEFSVHRLGFDSFTMAVIDVFWQLVSEGILAPGLNASNRDLPWFHITEYGKTVIAHGEYQPHDRDGYLRRLSTRNPNVDPTVLAYLEESLETFSRGNRVASMVMLVPWIGDS
jgi:hypothetical protein